MPLIVAQRIHYSKTIIFFILVWFLKSNLEKSLVPAAIVRWNVSMKMSTFSRLRHWHTVRFSPLLSVLDYHPHHICSLFLRNLCLQSLLQSLHAKTFVLSANQSRSICQKEQLFKHVFFIPGEYFVSSLLPIWFSRKATRVSQ